MRSMKKVFLCACSNLWKWKVSPRVYVVTLVVIVYACLNIPEISLHAASRGLGVTPWVFVGYYSSTLMTALYGFLVIMLFSNAPFADRQAPFLMIRTGRAVWLVGQIAYILIASFLFVLFHFILFIVLSLPNVGFSTDWGTVIRSLAINPEWGGMSTVAFSSHILQIFTGPEATALTFFLLWLVAVFLGSVIFCFNLLSRKNVGVVLAAFLVVFSYFAMAGAGELVLGPKAAYLAPTNWCCLSLLNWGGSERLPSFSYAVTVLSTGIVLFFTLSLIVFCKTDVVFRKEDL